MDIGSSFSKSVIREKGEVIAFDVIPSGGNYKDASEKVMEHALTQAGISIGDLFGFLSTGYGSGSVILPGRALTDISCISRGVSFLFPSARTIIDVGGQYSRVIRLDEHGRNTNFVLSERCAGGSGKFLQTIAHVLNIPFEEIGSISEKSENPVKFNTGCAVFAETEAISRIAEGSKVEDILAGVHTALAAIIQSLTERIGMEESVVLTGGGANDSGLVSAVSKALGVDVLVPEHPQIIAALGASLLAEENRAH